MIIIYDLDRTSLYCPIADKMDKFIPKKEPFKTFYYNLYPIVHYFEAIFGLLRINKNIYTRALNYSKIDGVQQIVITARHYSKSVAMHIKKVFKDIKLDAVYCLAQGYTNIRKFEVIDELLSEFDKRDYPEIIMYDDNTRELRLMRKRFKDCFTGINIQFKGKEEIKYVC